jgi:hypothetical protein
MDGRRFVRLPISPELLGEILDLPTDVQIVGVLPSDRPSPSEPINLWLQGDRFPEVLEGADPPRVMPTYTRHQQTVAKLDEETLRVEDRS